MADDVREELARALMAHHGQGGMTATNQWILYLREADAVLAVVDPDGLRVEVERLKIEGSPGVVHAVDKAFHDLAVGQRDRAWREVEGLTAERDAAVRELRSLRTVVARVVQQGGGVAGGGFARGGVIHTPSPEPVPHHASCERVAFHDPAGSPCTWRERPCVEAWPGCESGAYDPACCRFPKSCSVDDVPVPTTTPEADRA